MAGDDVALLLVFVSDCTRRNVVQQNGADPFGWGDRIEPRVQVRVTEIEPVLIGLVGGWADDGPPFGGDEWMRRSNDGKAGPFPEIIVQPRVGAEGDLVHSETAQ